MVQMFFGARLMARMRGMVTAIATASLVFGCSIVSLSAQERGGIGVGAGVGVGGSGGLGLGVGASVGGRGGVNAGLGASVGGRNGVDAGLGASVGGRNGINAGAGATVGGSNGVNAGAVASVGGASGVDAGVGASVGGPSGIDVDVGVGIGGGTTTTTPGATAPTTGRVTPVSRTSPSVRTPGRIPSRAQVTQDYSPAQLQRLKKRCVSILGDSGSYDNDLIALCKMLRG